MKYSCLLIFLIVLYSCNSTTKKQNEHRSESNNYSRYYNSYDNQENSNIQDESEEIDDGYSDGTHSATVDYYNPNTGYSTTYNVDVEVEDGQVRQINWPNGGWSDEDHITPGELDENGNVTIDGEDGKTFDVQIDDDSN